MVAEAGRLPVDNPATHLELTMIHEATILEYAGRDLALVELGSAMRLVILLGCGATCSCPGGWPPRPRRRPLALGAVVFVAKVAVLGAVLAASEVFMAKWRLFRVPGAARRVLPVRCPGRLLVLLPRMTAPMRRPR